MTTPASARQAWGVLWGAAFAAGLGAVHIGLALGADPDGVVLGVTALAGLLLVAAERMAPHRAAWLEPDGQWWNDLGHFFISFGFGSFAGAWLAQAAFRHGIWVVWPRNWPLPIQVVLGLVVAEFFGYWQHRWLHSSAVLWPLHALHHSTSRMTFFKTTRIHAFDIGSFTFLSVGSLMALGAGADVVLWVTAFGNFAAQTQHANVPLRTPEWLNRIVGTPAVHWLHHSLDLDEGNSNFGMNVMIFDHIFGTYRRPDDGPRAFGIQPDFVPQDFAGQLALPLETLRRLRNRRPS